MSVTSLGASAGDVNRAANHIVGYLEGSPQGAAADIESRRSQKGSAAPDMAPLTSALSSSGVRGGYFADSAEAPGRWRGEGAGADGFDLGTHVDPVAFRRVLLGQDPWHGEQLLEATGSAGRRRGRSNNPSTAERDGAELIDLKEVARIAGVDISYVQRLAKHTAEVRTAQRDAETDGVPGPETPSSYLDGHRDKNGQWLVMRSEAERFAGNRKEPQVVLGYDITFSVPKSVSAVYAQGTDSVQAAIEGAIEAAVSVGMAYLEREGFHVRRSGVAERAAGMVAASYRHYTNRNLEPQLHEHVVIANMATNSAGETRAVDARGLFAHGTTAGYLAGAELRHQLAERLGFSWAAPHKGLADIAGVDRSTIMAVSTRRQDVLALSSELGYHTADARQRAALATRPGKDRAVDSAELREAWRRILTDAGLGPGHVQRLQRTNDRAPWTSADTTALFSHLAGRRGVTEQAAIFDRRDVIQAIANLANDRMSAAAIEDLADQWLGTDAVVPLEINDINRRETIGNRRASLAPSEQRYTTPYMLRIEARVVELHDNGRNRSAAIVDPVTVEHAINAAAVDLGADQAAMVRAITTSGHQFQAVIGRAGAGKTTAIAAAVTAWETAGYRVIGAAPFGDAARKLNHETGLASTTLEGLLTRIEVAADPRTVIDATTVVIVDEASTIGNRQLDRLYRHANAVGATIRTIGDPHQHQSVEAGGLWKHLTSRFADDTPRLDHNRRQTGPDMGQVRIALDDYRDGLIHAALDRLDNDARIVTAPTWEQLLDTMAADWLVDHRRHLDHGAAPSKMVAERNADRHALNRRAQALLRSEGLLDTPVRIGDVDFHIGDRVVAQTRNTDLRPDGATRADHIINGSEGTITAIAGTRSTPALRIDFDGLGVIDVPHDFIATPIGPGRGGGITPAYAVTSFKAEGQTFNSGRNLAAPGATNTEGMYVALTRGRNDQRTYTIAPDDHHPEPPELPILRDDRTALQALADSLTKPRGEDLATLADPAAARVAAAATGPLEHLAGRARALAEDRVAATAIHNPHPVTVAALGPRPPAGAHRDLWDTAVGEAAIYRARWGTNHITPDGGVAPPAPGDRPAKYDDHDRVQATVLAASIEHLAHTPLADLATEHAALRAARLNTATHNHDTVEADLTRADQALEQARRQLRNAQRAEGRDGPGRRQTPLEADLYRRAAHDAERRIAAAETGVQRAKQRLSASNGDPAARAAINARLATINRAFDRRIDNAVQRPAPYLATVLGQRPRQQPDRQRWNTAARAIESYRQRHLNLPPSDGPRGGIGITRAIGPRPSTPAHAEAWDKTSAAIDTYLTPSRPHEQPLVRRR